MYLPQSSQYRIPEGAKCIRHGVRPRLHIVVMYFQWGARTLYRTLCNPFSGRESCRYGPAAAFAGEQFLKFNLALSKMRSPWHVNHFVYLQTIEFHYTCQMPFVVRRDEIPGDFVILFFHLSGQRKDIHPRLDRNLQSNVAFFGMILKSQFTGVDIELNL